jgi:hypothetical protein
MNPLTEQEINELDRAVDDYVPSLPLLSRSRDVALIHLLRFHESYMAGHSTLPNAGERENATKHGYDGMNHAVRWVFKFCPAEYSTPALAFDEDAYLKAEKLHNRSNSLFQVRYHKTSAYINICRGFVIQSNCDWRIKNSSTARASS